MATSMKNMVIWGVLYLLMLLSLITPIGLITVNLMMIPLLLLFVMLEFKRFLILYAVIAAILIVGLGNLGIVLMFTSMLFLIPSVVMGIQYRKGTSSGAVTSGIIALIAVILLLLMFSSAVGFNISGEFEALLKTNPSMMTFMESIVTDNQIDSYIDFMIRMFPVMIIMISVYYTMITHWLGRKLLTRMWKPVPKLKPMKEWMLPRSVIWYYVIVLVLYMITDMNSSSTLSVIVLNSYPLLTFAFGLQAVGLLFFIADLKGWNRLLPIVALILLVINPGLLAWIGVIDVAFPLRKWLKERLEVK